MHFRHLVAIVYREFIAQVRDVPSKSVTADDFYAYSISLREERGRQADTVRCIFQSLFQSDLKYQETAKYVTA